MALQSFFRYPDLSEFTLVEVPHDLTYFGTTTGDTMIVWATLHLLTSSQV